LQSALLPEKMNPLFMPISSSSQLEAFPALSGRFSSRSRFQFLSTPWIAGVFPSQLPVEGELGNCGWIYSMVGGNRGDRLS
jgi:hypothetical protein